VGLELVTAGDPADAPTKALIATIGAAAYEVQLGMADGLHAVEAIDQRSGETFVVRGDDLYRTVVELAQQVGIELEDG
jgi:hypothetical protein